MAASKPRLRGVLHHWAAVAAAGAGMALVALAPTVRSAVAAGIYAASLVTLFTISAVYHRVSWSPLARARMRRMDHASIFVLIAGTYTPIALLGIPSATGQSLLLAIWGGAVVGILQSLFWIHAPKLISAGLAVAVGWTIVPYLGAASRALGGGAMSLLLAGGIAYTVGAVAYAAKRPNPVPAVFGYHEVFHALTLVGAGFHFALVVHLLRAAGH